MIPSTKATRDYLFRNNSDEKLDTYEENILNAYEKGDLKTASPTKADLAKFKAAGRRPLHLFIYSTATFIKDKRINIRLSSPDLMDIQAGALEEGIPYQTFIASILHKFASGRLVEKPSSLTTRPTGRNDKRRTG